MNEETYYNRILTRIQNAEPEAVFVASDFVDIADVNTVWQTMMRLEKTHQITRIIRGVYYKPVYSEFLGEYEAPSPHHVAMALARKHNWTIAPSGVTALNQLGLSSQVSAKWSYISDGPTKYFFFSNTELKFIHRSNKEISGMSYKTAMVIQALRAIGKTNIDLRTIQKLQKLLTSKEKTILLKEAQQTTAWIYSIIKQICKEINNVSYS